MTQWCAFPILLSIVRDVSSIPDQGCGYFVHPSYNGHNLTAWRILAPKCFFIVRVPSPSSCLSSETIQLFRTEVPDILSKPFIRFVRNSADMSRICGTSDCQTSTQPPTTATKYGQINVGLTRKCCVTVSAWPGARLL
jgi:hypothetical protein